MTLRKKIKKSSIRNLAQKAQIASRTLLSIDITVRNKALLAIAQSLEKNKAEIISANKKDLAIANKAKNISQSSLKRLIYDEQKIRESIMQITSVISLNDPLQKTMTRTQLDNGLLLTQESCPIGVIGVIFESRPDALVQISALCLKSSNAVIMKGGSEALNTNRALTKIINQALLQTDIRFTNFVTLLESREEASQMLQCHEYINLIIPRGSNQLVQMVMHNTKIPVLGHADGICHIYVHSDADIAQAVPIIRDAKCQYPAVCNAVETLVVHTDIAQKLLPLLLQTMPEVEFRLDLRAKKYLAEAKFTISKNTKIKNATEKDWHTEYGDYILSIKIVDSLSDAINHINTYGSHHTDAIITGNQNIAETFMQQCDSANVFHNCSTRFADGYRYGLGAEIGISTSKIHARGPVGLEGLTIYKWKLQGNGHVVTDYILGQKKFNFKKM